MKTVSANAAETPFILPARPGATRVRQVDKAALLHPSGPRTMSMQGFEDRFVDIVDYIVRITEEIWTDRATERIYETYDPRCTVYTPYGVTCSVDEVVASTLESLASFPEEEALHLNVAWSGDDQRGFYTSHLGWTRTVNRGPSIWGPATGKEVEHRFVADCISQNNRIHTEWLVHDASALVRAIGLEVDAAAQLIAAQARHDSGGVAPPARQKGHNPHSLYQGERETADGWIRGLFHDIWMAQRIDRLTSFYAADAVTHWAGGRVASGPQAIGALITDTQSSLPGAGMDVQNICWSEETDGIIVAVRWTLSGETRRGGALGDNLPEGRLISVPGCTHLRFQGGMIAEEWTVFDEVAAIAQALLS